MIVIVFDRGGATIMIHTNKLITLVIMLCTLVSCSAFAEPGDRGTSSDAQGATVPEKVIVGAFINRIQELDFRNQSYSVDLYVWFRWRNKDLNPAQSLEFMNRFAPFEHVRSQIYETPLTLPDGSLYAIVRAQGRFSTRLGLERYPFDDQELVVELEDSASGTGNLVYVADDVPLTLSTAIGIAGFRVGQPRMEIKDYLYPTNFGNPMVGEQEAYSRATLIVPIHRPLTALAVKTFLPILLVLACAALVLFIRPAYLDMRVGLSVTALLTLLLTLVALQLARGATLSEVDYLTMIDKVYLASYMFIILVLLRIVHVSWRQEGAGNEMAIARADRAWLLVVMVAYVVVLATIFATSFAW